jgi:long-chain acyl-CoA synthetase
MEVRVASDGLREYQRAAPPDLYGLLDSTAAAWPEKTAFICDGETVSFADLRAGVLAQAAALATAGVTPGGRVGILLANSISFVRTVWAIWRLGAVAVPLNHRLHVDELVPMLRHADAKLLVTGGVHGARGHEIAARVGLVALRPNTEVSGSLTSRPATIDTGSPAAILFTSGTSGEARGVVLTHRNAIQSSLTCLEVVGRRHDDVELICVPQFNVTGLVAQTIPAVQAGMTTVLCGAFEPGAVLSAIVDQGVTAMVAAPTMWHRILAHPDLGRSHASSLRLVLTGGAPLPQRLLDRLRCAFPAARIGNGYGMTETCSMVTYIEGNELRRRPDSVGMPLPITDVRVVDPETGSEAPPGAPGELWCRGPQIASGYWRNDEATAKLRSGDWLRTGDIATIEPGGLIVLRDRIKDVIKRGGESVYCVEVEAAIGSHPDVVESAVVGVPDAELGERVGAVVVVAPGSTVTAVGIQESCGRRLGHFKVPAVIEFADALPRNASGKVLKGEIRKRLATA